MTYNSSIIIKPDVAKLIRHYLNDEPKTESEAFIDDIIIHSTAYPTGYEMELHCCGISYFEEGETNTAWGQAVLFDEYGNEVACEAAESANEFFDTWTFDGNDGNQYVAYIIVNEED